MSAIAIIKLVASLLYPIIEYLLGKTQNGSVIGAAANGTSAILKGLALKKSQGEQK